MAINERLVHTASAVGSGAAEAEQGLILHLDANDVDSYDGVGSVWYDISEYDVPIPLSNNADDLELHLNASDATSYDPTTGTTTWNDISGNARNATLTSMGNSSFDIDNGGFFDVVPTSDYVTIPYNAALVPTSTGYTFEGWYNFDVQVGGTNWSSIFGNWDESGSADGILIRFKGANIELFIYENGTSLFASASNSTSISTNEWFHVAFTLSTNASGGLVKVYVNGELKINGSLSGTYNPNSSQDLFMCYGGDIDIPTSRYFDGKVGAGRIYSKALSASEVGQNYRHGRDYIYTSLIADTNLELDFDPTSITSDSFTTWVDSKSSASLTKIGAIGRNQELGDFVSFGGSASDGFSGAITNTIKDGNNDYSIEYWWYYDSISNTASFVASKQSASFYGNYIYQSASTLYFDEYKSGTYSGAQSLSESYSTLGVTTGKWYHFTWVVDASTDIKLYIDGELKKTSTTGAGGTRWSALTNLEIGKSQSSYIGQGDCGGVRFYKQPLTADEVMQNYLFTKNKYPNENHATGNNMDSSDWNSDGYFDFNGSNEYFTIPNTLRPSVSTITMWIRPLRLNHSSWQFFYNYVQSSTYRIRIGITNGSNTIRFSTEVNNVEQAATSAAVNTSNWYHLTMIMDGNNVRSFVDKTELTTMSNGHQLTDMTATHILGGDGSAYPWRGYMSKVKIYDRALTTTEIDALVDEGY